MAKAGQQAEITFRWYTRCALNTDETSIRAALVFGLIRSLAPLWCCQATQCVLAIFHICRAT
jgi:hypothetical protein